MLPLPNLYLFYFPPIYISLLFSCLYFINKKCFVFYCEHFVMSAPEKCYIIKGNTFYKPFSSDAQCASVCYMLPWPQGVAVVLPTAGLSLR